MRPRRNLRFECAAFVNKPAIRIRLLKDDNKDKASIVFYTELRLFLLCPQLPAGGADDIGLFF